MGYFVYHGQSPVFVTADKRKANAKLKELKNLFPEEKIWIKAV